MKGIFKIDDPDEVSATLTITMTIGEWKTIRDNMADRYPGWDFKNLINNAVRTAEEKFYLDGKEQ